MDIIVNLKLDLACFAASKTSPRDYDLRAVIYHLYVSPGKGKNVAKIAAFVYVRGVGKRQPNVWKDFLTEGVPNVDVRRVTRAHNGSRPYVLLYEGWESQQEFQEGQGYRAYSVHRFTTPYPYGVRNRETKAIPLPVGKQPENNNSHDDFSSRLNFICNSSNIWKNAVRHAIDLLTKY
jgi:hypothetical protein